MSRGVSVCVACRPCAANDWPSGGRKRNDVLMARGKQRADERHLPVITWSSPGSAHSTCSSGVDDSFNGDGRAVNITCSAHCLF